MLGSHWRSFFSLSVHRAVCVRRDLLLSLSIFGRIPDWWSQLGEGLSENWRNNGKSQKELWKGWFQRRKILFFVCFLWISLSQKEMFFYPNTCMIQRHVWHGVATWVNVFLYIFFTVDLQFYTSLSWCGLSKWMSGTFHKTFISVTDYSFFPLQRTDSFEVT